MNEDTKLTEEKKEQLLTRIKECLDDDVFTIGDWMAIYGVMLEARERASRALYEECMIERISGGEEE